MSSAADMWRKRLESGEEHVVPGPLRAAMKFLLDAQIRGEGWAGYPHLPADLHVTAQVVTAARLFRHQAADVATGNAAVWIGSAFPSLDTTEDLISLLAVVEGQSDGTDTDGLRGKLAVNLGNGDPSTVLLARALLAAEHWPHVARATARPWVDRVLGRQLSDGSWSSAHLAEESVPVTAWAVRALAPWRDRREVATAADRGLTYLRSVLGKQGWTSPALTGTYVLTVVLRALATGSGQAELSEEGLDRLRLLQGPDGGWGGGPGEPSSSEHTAAAVIALAEFEAFRFVSLRLTRLTVAELQSELSELAKKQAVVNANIDAWVEERAGKILADRNRLQQRVDDLQASLKNARMIRRTVLLNLLKRSSVSAAKARRITVTGLMALLVVGMVVTWLNAIAMDRFGVVLRYGIAGVDASVTIALGYLIVRAEWRESHAVDGMAASFLMIDFIEMTDGLSARDSQELAYGLIREGAELPYDYAYRFFQEYIYRRKFPLIRMRQLDNWITAYLKADGKTRKEFLAHLRETLS